jgi:SOS response associated peptidase (SRAP)
LPPREVVGVLARGTARHRVLDATRLNDAPAQPRKQQTGRAASARHNRMPVVLKPDGWPVWLGEEPANPRQLKALLAPYPSEGMTCWPVSTRVGNVKNNDPSLIEPTAVQ